MALKHHTWRSHTSPGVFRSISCLLAVEALVAWVTHHTWRSHTFTAQADTHIALVSTEGFLITHSHALTHSQTTALYWSHTTPNVGPPRPHSHSLTHTLHYSHVYGLRKTFYPTKGYQVSLNKKHRCRRFAHFCTTVVEEVTSMHTHIEGAENKCEIIVGCWASWVHLSEIHKGRVCTVFGFISGIYPSNKLALSTY